jgi:hypothetical protein
LKNQKAIVIIVRNTNNKIASLFFIWYRKN